MNSEKVEMMIVVLQSSGSAISSSSKSFCNDSNVHHVLQYLVKLYNTRENNKRF